MKTSKLSILVISAAFFGSAGSIGSMPILGCVGTDVGNPGAGDADFSFDSAQDASQSDFLFDAGLPDTSEDLFWPDAAADTAADFDEDQAACDLEGEDMMDVCDEDQADPVEDVVRDGDLSDSQDGVEDDIVDVGDVGDAVDDLCSDTWDDLDGSGSACGDDEGDEGDPDEVD